MVDARVLAAAAAANSAANAQVQQNQNTAAAQAATVTYFKDKNGRTVRQITQGNNTTYELASPDTTKVQNVAPVSAPAAPSKAVMASQVSAPVAPTVTNFIPQVISGPGAISYYNGGYDIDTAIAFLQQQASANGITLPAYTKYGNSIANQDKANSILKNYVDALNSTAGNKVSFLYSSDVRAVQAPTKPVTYYDVDSALKTVVQQAKAAGIIINPPAYGNSVTSQAIASQIVKQWVDNVNNKMQYNEVAVANAPSVTANDLNTRLNDIYTQARSTGLATPPSPTKYVSGSNSPMFSASGANNIINSYIDQINAAINNQNKAIAAASLVSQSKSPTISSPSVSQGTGDNDPNSVNSYGLTRAQWQQYQNSQAGQPDWARASPVSWMWQNNINGYRTNNAMNPGVGNYDGGSWTYSPSATSTTKAQAAAKAVQITNIDPQKTSRYAFQTQLNDAWSQAYLDAKQENPNLTEYQFRLQHTGANNGGVPMDTVVVKGTYTTPYVANPAGLKGNAANVGTSLVSSFTPKVISPVKAQPVVNNPTPVTTDKLLSLAGLTTANPNPGAPTGVLAPGKTYTAPVTQKTTQPNFSSHSNDIMSQASDVMSNLYKHPLETIAAGANAAKNAIETAVSVGAKDIGLALGVNSKPGTQGEALGQQLVQFSGLQNTPEVLFSEQSLKSLSPVAPSSVKSTPVIANPNPTVEQNAASVVSQAANMWEKSLQAGDIDVSDFYTSKLPSARSIEDAVSKVTPPVIGTIEKLTPEPIKNNPTVKTAASIASQIGAGVESAASHTYTDVRAKPWTTFVDTSEFAVAAAGAGAQVGTAKLLGVAGLAEAGSMLEGAGLIGASDVAITLAKSVPLAVDTILTGSVAAGAKSNIEQGYNEGGIAGASQAATRDIVTLGIGGKLFAEGAEANEKSPLMSGFRETYKDINPYKAADVVPKVETAKISQMEGSGASSRPVDLPYGKSIAIVNTPIITKVSGEGLLGGIKLGAAPAPESLLAGKTTQSFSKAENPFFMSTVANRGAPVESEYLSSALKIVKSVGDTIKPINKPEKFEITSKAIPEEQRSTITKSITSYNGDVMVAGSVPMKAQSNPFTTRTPHDLELYGDDAEAIVQHITTDLTKAGFKEGIDYKVQGSKVQFQVEENGKKIWDTGIEAFTHSEHATQEAIAKQEIAEFGSAQPSKPSVGKSEIAFGYGSKSPVMVPTESGDFIKTQNLAEQLTRKVAGSTMFKDSELQPAHPNRVKDILDTTTTATAFAVLGKKPIAGDVVGFVNAASEKFTPITEDLDIAKSLTGRATTPEESSAMMKANFQEKVATDPVFSFIRENQRLPTLEEMPSLTDVKISDKSLLYSSKAKTIETGNPLVDNVIGGKSRDISDITGRSRESPVSTSPIPDFMGSGVSESQSPFSGSSKNRKISQSPFTSLGSSKPSGMISPTPSKVSSSPKPSPVSKITASPAASIISPSPSQKPTLISKSQSPMISQTPSRRSQSPVSRNGKSPSSNPTITSQSPIASPFTSPTPKIVSSSPMSQSPSSRKSPSPVISPSPSPSPKPMQSKSPSPSPKPGKSPSPSPITSKSPSPSPIPSPTPKSPSPISSKSPSPSPNTKSPSPSDIIGSPSPSPGSSSPSSIIGGRGNEDKKKRKQEEFSQVYKAGKTPFGNVIKELNPIKSFAEMVGGSQKSIISTPKKQQKPQIAQVIAPKKTATKAQKSQKSKMSPNNLVSTKKGKMPF